MKRMPMKEYKRYLRWWGRVYDLIIAEKTRYEFPLTIAKWRKDGKP